MCGDLIVNEFHRGFFHGATCRGSSSDFDLCDACAHCRMLGYDPFKAATVSYWCEEHKEHVRPRELCDEYAPGDPLRMAMREYWKEAEADGC